MINQIEHFCRLKGISFSRFGNLVLNDPNLVFKLSKENPRILNVETAQKIKKWMEENAKTDLRVDRDRRETEPQNIDGPQLAAINHMELFSATLLTNLWKSHRKILKHLAAAGLNVVEPRVADNTRSRPSTGFHNLRNHKYE